jgi:hypothetical protein
MRLFLTGLSSVAVVVLSIPMLLMALPFLLFSKAVRWFSSLTEPDIAAASSLMQFDPDLGWKPQRNLNAHYLIRRDDIYPVVTDSMGWPGLQSLDESQIVVVGDSFAYGYGARQGESFADRLTGLKVKSLASLGYDMVQELLLLRSFAPQLSGKLVLWWIYVENDLVDNMRPELRGYRKPFVAKDRKTGSWQVVTSHVRSEPWRHTLPVNGMEVFAHLCAQSPIADYYYDACDWLVGQAVEVCREHDASLVIMTIPNVNQLSADGNRRLLAYGVNPESFDPAYPDRRIGEICKKQGVPFVPLMPRFVPSDYKEYERFHWNPSGHRKAAAAILEAWDTFAQQKSRPGP